jgi:hypothetical protein
MGNSATCLTPEQLDHDAAGKSLWLDGSSSEPTSRQPRRTVATFTQKSEVLPIMAKQVLLKSL